MDLSSIINQINEEVAKETENIKPEIEEIKDEKKVFNNDSATETVERARKSIIAASVEKQTDKNLVKDVDYKEEKRESTSRSYYYDDDKKTSSSSSSGSSNSNSGWWSNNYGQQKVTVTKEQKARDYANDRVKRIDRRVKSQATKEEEHKKKLDNWDIFTLREEAKMSNGKKTKQKKKSKMKAILKTSALKGVVYACKTLLEELYKNTIE
jgi:hypothetical protein